MLAAVVNEAEEDAELCPRAVAEIEGIGVAFGVVAQALEESVDAVTAAVKLRGGQEVAVFGEENEDEPHEDGEESAVEIVGVFRENIAQERAAALSVSVLEAAKEFVEGLQHLPCESGRDAGLVFAAALEERGETALARGSEEAVAAKQEMERGEDGAPGDLGHRGDGEGERAGVFAAGGVDEAEVGAAGEQADGDIDAAQEPLEALGRGGVPSAGVSGGARVEVGAGRELLDEEKPRARGVGGLGFAEGEVGREGFALGQRELERFGDFGGEAVFRPVEKPAEECGQIADGGKRFVFAELRRNLADERRELFLQRGELAAVEDGLCIDERGRRDDEAVGLEVAEPGLVIEDGGVDAHAFKSLPASR
jgi:hypothetical protein